MSRFENKVVVVTGATGGIGEATARALVAEGASVVLADLDEGRLGALAEELGQRAAFRVVDVASEADNRAMVHLAVERFGALHGLFLNAGIEGQVGPLETRTEEAWRRVLDVNLHGVRYGIVAALDAMRAAGGGSIVITSSVAGLIGAPGLAPYVSSKHAVMGLMKTAAAELAPQGIRVNSVNPGPVDNRMMRSIEEQASPGHGDAVKAGFVARVPLGRYVTNEEVARVACFLLSDESAGVVGAHYVVDGGLNAI